MRAPALGNGLRVEVAGDALVLFPERALYWERAESLLVADVHWGKAATFRALGVPVPRGTTQEGLTRLDALISRTGARRVVFLGDLLHARAGRAPETLRVLAEWRERHPLLELVLVRGNHDRHAGDPPEAMRVHCVNEPLVERPFALAHTPGARAEGYALAGHLHPGARLYGAARQQARLPCFWFQRDRGVLPAFGDFTGLADVSPMPDDRLFVVADQQVLPVVMPHGG
jgi:uncharacterized protein